MQMGMVKQPPKVCAPRE
uniref:Uncharacterized protein n=1 Tax=Rhizophora mucronata TaxID=61149 RepID=A0A2P2QUZ3_RHIMU